MLVLTYGYTCMVWKHYLQQKDAWVHLNVWVMICEQNLNSIGEFATTWMPRFTVNMMGRLWSVQRERAIGMLQCGRSFKDVAATFQVHKSTISRLWRKFQDTKSTADLCRSRRPCVTTPKQDRQIRLWHLRNRFSPATLTATQAQGMHNNPISTQTVCNRLRDAHMMARRLYGGLFLTPPRWQNRVRWVRA